MPPSIWRRRQGEGDALAIAPTDLAGVAAVLCENVERVAGLVRKSAVAGGIVAVRLTMRNALTTPASTKNHNVAAIMTSAR